MTGAGNLDRRITIERFTSTTNAFNEEVKAWLPFITVWASREDVSDGEKVAAGQGGASLRSRFVIRWSDDSQTITPMDRISYGTVPGSPEQPVIWSIHGVKETKDGRRRFIEITAVRDSDVGGLV